MGKIVAVYENTLPPSSIALRNHFNLNVKGKPGTYLRKEEFKQ